MYYLIAEWRHNFLEEPEIFYIELDEDRYQTRAIEVYKDGSIAFVSQEVEYNTFLAPVTYPAIDEINVMEGDEFFAKPITKEEFEQFWAKYVLPIYDEALKQKEQTNDK